MASTKLSRAAGTPTSSKKFTISYWTKKVSSGTQTNQTGGEGHIFDTYTDGNNRTQIGFDTNNVIDFRLKVSGTNIGRLVTTRTFEDQSAFYHIVAEVDTTLATADDRLKLYVNGTQETNFSSRTNPSLNDDFSMGGTHTIGAYGGGTNYYDGLLCYFSFTDGYAYNASNFGSTNSSTGIWEIKTSPSVTYGTNGFYLKMDTTSPGSDSSGNNNTFTASGTPTLTQESPSNLFPIVSKVVQPMLESNATITDGGTTSTSSSSDYTICCTMGAKKGKWYWEVKMGNAGNTRSPGVVRADQLRISGNSSGFYPGGDGNATNFTSAWNSSTGFVQTNTAGSQVQVTSGVTTTTSGDIVGVALDLDSYTINFYKNGSADGTGTLSAAWVEDFVLPCARADHTQIMNFNFGNGFFGTTAVTSSNTDAAGYGLFEYAVPTGYYALCTKNLNTYG